MNNYDKNTKYMNLPTVRDEIDALKMPEKDETLEKVLERGNIIDLSKQKNELMEYKFLETYKSMCTCLNHGFMSYNDFAMNLKDLNGQYKKEHKRNLESDAENLVLGTKYLSVEDKENILGVLKNYF